MWTLIAVLILVGLLMLVLEILVVPGAGVAGIIGFGLMIAGVFLAYDRIGMQEGHITLAATLAINILGLVWVLRSRTWKRAMLQSSIKGKVNVIEPERLNIGDTGLTVSRCAPAGKAMIGNELFEVHAQSQFIDEEEKIEVIKIIKNKIIIRKI